MAIGGPVVVRSATGRSLAEGPPGQNGKDGLPGPQGDPGLIISVTASAPLIVSGDPASPILSMPAATDGSDGFMLAADKAKLDALSPGGGGVPLNGFAVSPADQGVYWGAGTAGNFTVGMAFYFLRPCTWTGVRFGAVWAGAKTWKVRAYAVPGAVALGIATAAGLVSGTNTILFAAAIPITTPQSLYVVSAYDMSGALFAGAAPAAPALSVVGPLGPSVYLADDSYYAAGDAQPTGGGSSNRMAVEPVFTVP
jgi:hypothetical protein